MFDHIRDTWGRSMCNHAPIELIANRESEADDDGDAAETPPPLVPNED